MKYRFITQDIIDAGSINITSPEMYSEAREYNIDAGRNYIRRRNNHLAMAIWFGVQPLLVIFAVVLLTGITQLDQVHTGRTTSNARIIVAVVGFISWLLIYGYFVVLRKQRSGLMMFLTSLPLLLVHWSFAVICIANFVIGKWYTGWEKKLSERAGYPGFTQLSITTIDSEANTVEELTFENIRERAVNMHRHDGTFLK